MTPYQSQSFEDTAVGNPPLLPICTVIVMGALFAAWWMTGWYGAGIVLLTWVALSAIAAMVLAMQRSNAARLEEASHALFTCNGTCGQTFTYGLEVWIDVKPYCLPCAKAEQARSMAAHASQEVA